MLFNFLSKLFKKREESSGAKANGEDEKPFLEHLEDLRWAIVKMVVTLVIGLVLCFIFAHDILRWLQYPMIAAGLNPDILRNDKPFAAVMISIQLSFYASITLTLPILMYFLGEFVMPALTNKEKKYTLPALGVGFLIGLIARR